MLNAIADLWVYLGIVAAVALGMLVLAIVVGGLTSYVSTETAGDWRKLAGRPGVVLTIALALFVGSCVLAIRVSGDG